MVACRWIDDAAHGACSVVDRPDSPVRRPMPSGGFCAGVTMTKEEKLKQIHERELLRAKESGKCPACGATLDHVNMLRDRGWRYGVECDCCR